LGQLTEERRHEEKRTACSWPRCRLAASVRDSDANAWKLFAGYRFTRWFSVEAAYITSASPTTPTRCG
jgi:hypothetical protein